MDILDTPCPQCGVFHNVGPCQKEVIVVDPLTGGKKGTKQERFDLLPVEALEEVTRVYAYGATKYGENNYRKGYKWGLSFAAMMRHAWAFWRGETFDPETGFHHLAHCAFHCLALITFTKFALGTDDRVISKAKDL